MSLLQSLEQKLQSWWYPVFLIVACALLAATAIARGPWIDEYWMQWLADPSLGFMEILKTRWLGDMHPPAYEMAFWLIQQAGALSIPAARLYNFAAIGFGLGFGGLLAWHYRQERLFLMLFSSAAVASWFFFNAFGDFRSYCFGNVFFCLLLSALKIIQAEPQEGQKRWPVWTVFAISLFMSLNIHYISIVITVFTVATFAFGFLYQGRARLFFILAISGTIGILPTGIFAIEQAGYLSHALPNFWLKSDAIDGLLVYYAIVLVTLQTLCVYSFVFLRKLAMRAKDQSFVPAPQSDQRFSRLLISSVLIIAVTLYVANFHTSLLLVRYVVLLSFSITAALIAWVTPTIARNGRIYSVTILNAFVFLGFVGSFTALEKRWYESAVMVKEQLNACPAARVLTKRLSTYEEKQIGMIMKLGYANLAQQFDIPLTSNMEDTAWLEGAPCPDIIWFAYLETGLLQVKTVDELIAVFRARNPGHANCDVKVLVDKPSTAAVFLVSNDPKSCAARK